MRIAIMMCLTAGLVFGANAPIVPTGARVEKVTDTAEGVRCRFTEGPATDRDGSIYFSDGPNQRIVVARPDSTVKVWKQPSGRANGMRFDARGRLVTCCAQGEGGARAVIRYDAEGRPTVLADRYRERRLNAPNDLCFDARGRIYFTDPAYGERPADGQDRFAVYRIEAEQGEPVPNRLTRVIEDLDTPNGILMAPDGKTLYVADNAARPDGPHTLVAYEVRDDSSVKRRHVVYDFGRRRGIDGMMLDRNGNLYVTAESDEKTGVYLIAPEGRLLGFIPTPETATNCMWGGRDFSTLYITAGASLYRIRLNARGWWVFP